MRGWISGDPAERSAHRRGSERPLDLALVGLGVLNSRHQFYVNYDQNVQLGAIAGHIETLKTLQAEDPSLLAVVQGINEAILAVPPERIKTAGEMVMVVGGAQKVNALVELLTGRWLDALVDLDNLTLVTDAWTAQQVIQWV